MSTGLTTTNHGGGLIGSNVYDRIAEPMQFINEMGKVFAHSGACGVKTEAEGKTLALACLCERANPFEINRKYHLIDGKLSMRSDAMLAEFRARGGKHVWTAIGDDGKKAEARFTYDGNDLSVSYTIEEAKNAGLVRNGSAWTKDPGSMLRARVISRAVRMLCPEVVAGVYTPEEIEDFRSESPALREPVRSADEVAERRKQLQEMQAAQAAQAAETQPVAAPQGEQQSAAVIEAEVVPADDTPPFDPTPAPETVVQPQSQPQEQQEAATELPGHQHDALLMEVESLCSQAGMTKAKFEESLRARNPSFKTIDDLPVAALEKLVANLRSKLGK